MAGRQSGEGGGGRGNQQRRSSAASTGSQGGRGGGGGGRGRGGGGRGGGGGGDGRGDGRGGRGKRNSVSGNAKRQPSGRGGQGNKSSLQAAAGGGGGGANKNGSSNSNKSSLQAAAVQTVTVPTISFDEVELLLTTGCGDTPTERAITRYSTDKFLSCRMDFLDQPAITKDEKEHSDESNSPKCIWTPHERVHWTPVKDRLNLIRTEQDNLWNYQPLQINNATRWKARVMVKKEKGEDAKDEEKEHDTDAIMAKAVGIMNKLSWTTLEKLTIKFLQAITIPTSEGQVVPADVMKRAMALVVDKASLEPHFSELYATFVRKISSENKKFKKTLLSICQEEFQSSHEIVVDLPEDCDPAERNIEILRQRKKAFGLMQFIGELYKMNLLKGGIMIGCLQEILAEKDTDEDRLQCFVKLLTTAGKSLQDEFSGTDTENDVQKIWSSVYVMAGKIKTEDVQDGVEIPKVPSTRIKFLLQDLVELKENGWVQRRKEEKAKTLDQIKKDVAKEEQEAAAASRNPPRMGRSQSSGGVNTLGGRGSGANRRPSQQSQQMGQHQSQQQLPEAGGDEDGFVQVSKVKKTSFRRSQSDTYIANATGKSSLQAALSSSNASQNRSNSRSPKVVKKVSSKNNISSMSSLPEMAIKELLPPKECAEKAKNILKEYFVGGDTDDAVLSMHELSNVGQNGDVERGSAMIEAVVLMVMEMKETDVEKMLNVVSRCLKENKIHKDSVATGLNDPLEFLRDIEIDAPRAASLLAMIIADWLKQDVLKLDLLLSAPEYFKTDGRPAEFAALVLAKRGGDISDPDLDVVTKLMTEEEKKSHESTRKFIESFAS